MKEITKNEIYKHYIGLDWSKVNFALASIRDNGTNYKVVEHPPDLKILKNCLKELLGKKILTIEETTTAQWLSRPRRVYPCRHLHIREIFPGGLGGSLQYV